MLQNVKKGDGKQRLFDFEVGCQSSVADPDPHMYAA